MQGGTPDHHRGIFLADDDTDGTGHPHTPYHARLRARPNHSRPIGRQAMGLQPTEQESASEGDNPRTTPVPCDRVAAVQGILHLATSQRSESSERRGTQKSSRSSRSTLQIRITAVPRPTGRRQVLPPRAPALGHVLVPQMHRSYRQSTKRRRRPRRSVSVWGGDPDT